MDLADLIADIIHREVAEANGATAYRTPLVGYPSAADPRFRELRRAVEPTHYLPEEMLPGARTIISFFLPFAAWVVEANTADRHRVAREWPVADLETNALIGRIVDHLIAALAERGVRAAAAPARHNYDLQDLIARWSH